MDKPKITICIPAYDMGGRGARYLADLFASLERQTFRDFDVVVSNQGDSTDIEDLCIAWQDRLKIACLPNQMAERSASVNVNHALDNAAGEILKILFQDDLLWSENALSQLAQAADNSRATWFLCGSGVTKDGSTLRNIMVPRLNPKLAMGKNTVSSPSVLAIRRRCSERFDENLQWLMDVEYYHRLRNECGEPEIISETHVANRLHDGQVSARIDRKIKARELDYVLKRHRSTLPAKTFMEYAKRRLKTVLAI